MPPIIAVTGQMVSCRESDSWRINSRLQIAKPTFVGYEVKSAKADFANVGADLSAVLENMQLL
jgi:hypothetical protein